METNQMKSFLKNIRNVAAAGVTFLAGVVVVSLGFTFMTFLAVFALAAIGLAILATPFLVRRGHDEEEDHDDRFNTNAFSWNR